MSDSALIKLTPGAPVYRSSRRQSSKSVHDTPHVPNPLKVLGVTHITNGCYRLHPVEWNIGESAGLLAAFCLKRKAVPRQVRGNRRLLEESQRELAGQGIEIRWPRIGPV